MPLRKGQKLDPKPIVPPAHEPGITTVVVGGLGYALRGKTAEVVELLEAMRAKDQ